jgi:hypothetical protein
MKRLIFLCAALTFIGASCPNRAEYSKVVNACVDNSTTAEQYEACCIDAARRYGADPADCLLQPGADGGAS